MKCEESVTKEQKVLGKNADYKLYTEKSTE